MMLAIVLKDTQEVLRVRRLLEINSRCSSYLKFCAARTRAARKDLRACPAAASCGNFTQSAVIYMLNYKVRHVAPSFRRVQFWQETRASLTKEDEIGCQTSIVTGEVPSRSIYHVRL